MGFGPGKVRVRVRAAGLCHSGLSERPRVRAKFDSERETFTYDGLDALLTPHYAGRPRGETFAAAEVLGLKRG